MNIKYLILLSAFLALISCENKSPIEGLWLVKSVTVGEEEMTPNGRWMRFNADSTQQSGNGWLQHSIGTWKFDPTSQHLRVINTNGLDDSSDPFEVTLSDQQMIWKRVGEGQAVEVRLEKATQLPMTYGDQLMGLWKLEEAEGNGSYFSPSKINKDYLFFRWDKRFVIGSDQGKINGVYRVHGHKPEVELIPYNNAFERNFWRIQFEEHAITLKLLNTDSTVTRRFKRIHKFPQ